MRSLLVHVDAGPRNAARLVLARRLAERFGSEATALFATLPPPLDLPFGNAAGTAGDAAWGAPHAARIARARTEVERWLPSARWAELRDPQLIEGVADQAACADLLLLGQDGDGDEAAAAGLPPQFAQALVTATGAPVLLVPRTGRFDTVGRVALVAWQPTPPAQRALRAALPLLTQAQQVHVVCWGASVLQPCAGEPLGLQRYLAAHGVQASLHGGASTPRHVGEALLEHAGALGADLLVMGCFGHSRTRERVLGGASRSVLQRMHLPVLTSH